MTHILTFLWLYSAASCEKRCEKQLFLVNLMLFYLPEKKRNPFKPFRMALWNLEAGVELLWPAFGKSEIWKCIISIIGLRGKVTVVTIIRWNYAWSGGRDVYYHAIIQVNRSTVSATVAVYRYRAKVQYVFTGKMIRYGRMYKVSYNLVSLTWVYSWDLV